MAILALQGIRGGVGTTTVAAALAWALQMLDEKVLLIDGSPDNLLRLSFNIDFAHRGGWGRAMLDGDDWRSAAWRYTHHLDVLPFGQMSDDERVALSTHSTALNAFRQSLDALKASGGWQWIILDLPHGSAPLTRLLGEAADHTLVVVRPDANCHVRLHQQPLPPNAHILLNYLRVGSQLQDDIFQLWLQSQRHLLPILIHRDESMAECLAAKQPLGEYRPDALAAEEMMTLANWSLLHFSGRAG